MINTEYFKGKRVTVVGIARSGVACAHLLHELGAQVSVTDAKDDQATRLNASRLHTSQIQVELGAHRKECIIGRDLIIVSPGIPREALPIAWAQELQIPVISEIEFAWKLCPATVIAVTGSNGKTTVTTLIGQVLEAAGKKAFVCGNIGNPFSGEVAKMQRDDFVSLEVSSFQLEHAITFKPKIAAILNFSRNHLDRHKDMQEYLRAKKRIFMNQQESDHLVLNAQDPIVKELHTEAKSHVTYFRESKAHDPNQAAVMAVASLLGIESSIAQKVFQEFRGVEHRVEFVAQINGVRFINDSKATTVGASVWALNRVDEKIILIAGGRDKGNDYSLIREVARQKVSHAVLIGEAARNMEEAFKGVIVTHGATTLEEAVRIAYALAELGDSVLLSPMCASFDMFTDYEHRGKVFKTVVQELSAVSKE